jgi:hypothetical protein
MDGIIVVYKEENRIRIIDQSRSAILSLGMIGTMYEIKRCRCMDELNIQTTNKEVKKPIIRKMNLHGPKSWKAVTKTTKQFNRHVKRR